MSAAAGGCLPGPAGLFFSPMKNKLVVLVLAVLCLIPGARCLRAQGGAATLGPGSVAIKNINLSVTSTPEFTTLENQTQVKRYTLGKWLEVEVEFTCVVPAKEITLHYNILLANTLLVGEVTHVDILPGQSLFSVMYIAPRAITTVLKGAPLTSSSIQNVDVQIVRPGVAAPLAEKMLKPGPAFYNTLQQVTGLVLNKNQTPFANLWWDRYEPIKPSTAGQ